MSKHEFTRKEIVTIRFCLLLGHMQETMFTKGPWNPEFWKLFEGAFRLIVIKEVESFTRPELGQMYRDVERTLHNLHLPNVMPTLQRLCDLDPEHLDVQLEMIRDKIGLYLGVEEYVNDLRELPDASPEMIAKVRKELDDFAKSVTLTVR